MAEQINALAGYKTLLVHSRHNIALQLEFFESPQQRTGEKQSVQYQMETSHALELAQALIETVRALETPPP